YLVAEVSGIHGIYRANLDGSDLELFFLFYGDRESRHALDVDPRHQKLYWAEDSEYLISFDASQWGGVGSDSISWNVDGVAVDPGREQVYWIDRFENEIVRANARGRAVETVASRIEGTSALALDLARRNVYRVSEKGPILRVSMDGGEEQILRVENGVPTDIAIDAPRGHLYWTTFAGQIVRANLDGTERTVVASDLAGDGFPSGIALQLDCGNGRIDPGETCDVAIEPGWTGECVTECFDNDPCTSDEVTRPGTCSARCEFETITEPIDRDGCCPNDSFTLVDDSDCTLSPWPDVPAVSTWGAVLLSLLLAVGITLKWRGHQAAA
ncbi:MAG: hypothetical protein IID35_10020, partial [Planctomycetes bacterium]|nr:hypothetical protein [Planctomycetota bacterium]